MSCPRCGGRHERLVWDTSRRPVDVAELFEMQGFFVGEVDFLRCVECGNISEHLGMSAVPRDWDDWEDTLSEEGLEELNFDPDNLTFSEEEW